MLGEQISENKGRVTSRRVLTVEGIPKIEVSFEGITKVLNIEAKDLGTYWSVVRSDGSIYGEGRGILMGNKGEAVSWKATGVGRFTDAGGTEFRGSIFYETQTEALAKLNSIVGVFEFSEDAEGNTIGKTWEWS